MRFNLLALRKMSVAVALMGAAALAVQTGQPRTVKAQTPTPAPRHPPIDHRAEQAYWAQRYGPITAADYQAAQQQAKQLPQASHLPPVNRAASGNRPAAASPLTASWTSLGPAPINSFWGGGISAGRVAAIAIDPTTSGPTTTIYIGAAGGGVWKSTNNGASWTPLTDTQTTMASGAIAIDPSNQNTIYVGTGEPNQSLDSYRGSGVLKSTNGGTSWTLLGTATFGSRGSAISRIAIDPNNGNIYAASTKGLFVSSDGGATWTRPPGVPTNTADDVVINSSGSPSIIYALVRFKGLYRSSDGGATWPQLTNGLSAGSGWDRSALAMAPSNHSVLYLVTSNGGTVANRGFYTNDGGTTWSAMTSLSTDITGGEPWYALVLAVDPLNPKAVYGGGLDMYYTPNAQAAVSNWQQLSYWYNANSLHADQHGIAFASGCTAAPCRLYIANDGGVYYTNNPGPGATYVDLNTAPLAISEFTGGDLAINFSTTALALGGTQDNGTDLYTGNAIWNENDSGDGGFTQIDQSNTQYMYDEYIYADIHQSTDGGMSFNLATTGLPPTGDNYIPETTGALFYSPFVLDRSNDNHLAISAGKAVYETTTATSSLSWYQSSPIFGSQVSAVGISPNNSAVIYAGLTNGTLYETTNANSGSIATYNQLTTPTGSGYVSSITFDPTDTTNNTVFVTTGKTNYNNGGIYKTINGGLTWQNITGTLPSYPVNTAVIYYAGATRVIVVGTDFGVFFTINDGVTWQGLNTGLPNVPVVQLALDKQQTTLAAYTHGRSVWAVGVPGITGLATSTPSPTATPSPTPTSAPPPPRIDSIGVYRAGSFYLRLHNTTGFADISVAFNPGAKPYPVVGDWTNAGYDRVGTYDQTNGLFSLCILNDSTACANSANVLNFVLGNPQDMPLSGRWQLGAANAGVGVFRPSNGLIYLKNYLTTGFADHTMILGIPGDTGLAGDWTNKGFDSPGVYRATDQHFYLSNVVTDGPVFGDIALQYGNPGDFPVTGDWIAQGHDGVGLFRQSDGFTYLRNTLTTGFADIPFVYGDPNDIPVAGHWQLTYPPAPPPSQPGSVLVPATSAPAAPVATPTPNGLID